MPTYIRRAASVYDANADDYTGAEFLTGTDPQTDTGLTNGTEYVVQEAVLSPVARFTPSVAPTYTVGNVATTDGTARLTGTMPATDPTLITAWFIARRSETGTAQDIMDASSGGLRIIGRAGGNYRLQITSTASNQVTVTSTNNANVDELVAVLMRFEASTDAGLHSIGDTESVWDGSATVTGTPPINSNLSGSTLTIASDVWAGGIVRFGFATGVALDISSATVRDALATGDGSAVSPVSDASILQSLVTGGGGTVLIDHYGGTDAANAAFNAGSLTLSATGTFT